MKKSLLSMVISVAVFATTTLSAAGYWEVIMEYLPDWRDFVPGMARPQIEETVLDKKPVLVQNQKLVKHVQPQSKPALEKKETAPVKAPDAPPTLAKTEKTAPAPANHRSKVAASRLRRARMNKNKPAVQKPTSMPINHPSRVAAPSMALSINLEQGMRALASEVTKAPFVENHLYNKDLFLGVVGCVNALSNQVQSPAFSKLNKQFNQSYHILFAPRKAKKAYNAPKLLQSNFDEFQKCLLGMAAMSAEFNVAVLDATIKNLLVNTKKILRDRKINVLALYGRLLAMQILADHSGHSSAVHLTRLVNLANELKEKHNIRALAADIDIVLKSL